MESESQARAQATKAFGALVNSFNMCVCVRERQRETETESDTEVSGAVDGIGWSWGDGGDLDGVPRYF